MQGHIMVAQAQGGGICGTTHARDLRIRHAPGWMGQADMGAGNRNPRWHRAIQERDLRLGLSAQRTYGAYRRAPEALGRTGFFLGLG
ncbi:hypothetical protein AA0614_0757 [Komagataeibacter saccharivorans NRIC 0614]|nr:hypothetical protein AA0614_0757 [Komagataeibacter saccharivorans NRIC 0614]